MWKWFFLLVVFSSIYAQKIDISVAAEGAILINPHNQKVLFAKNEQEPFFPASITKIATFIYILDNEHFDPEAIAIASHKALTYVAPRQKQEGQYQLPPYWLETDGSSLGLKPFERMPIKDLLYALMLRSGNDAANVLAENCAGSIDVFMNGVNQYLAHLGCTSTHFDNPHGLHFPTHQTTARDMSLIMAKALTIPFFREIVSSESYLIAPTNMEEKRTIKQYNRLLKKGKYHYPWAIGGKTGYHSKARYNLVVAAEKDGRMLIAVLLNEPSSELCYKDAIALFDRAFSETKKHKLLWDTEKIFTVKIVGATALLEASPSLPVSYSYFASEEPQIFASIAWQNVALPIRKGQEVGVIRIHDENNILLVSMPLLAKSSLEPHWLSRLGLFFSNLLKQ
ncbi:MAG: D-alanyl-D-alanine carboxypeptidase [Parachlamydiales bacterium]|nr:D-alanyl-D-alanine carboxypeptidase [Parachlamydiales bacterium]